MNMRTGSARKLAAKKSGETLRFYKAFLAELKGTHRMDFRVRSAEIRRPGRRSGRVKVLYVVPATCGSCGGRWEADFRTEKGLKCDKLEAAVKCGTCGAHHQISFCLPELA
jgi:hypothetical protein